ncbi:uncharacterized protein [Montipora capricornis]|uniref:uncharacterized protein n=1 Tax=Montipora capricornis TaxID=246305 RepID=UPI0035F1953B
MPIQDAKMSSKMSEGSDISGRMVSPLNALIRDQVTKLRQSGLKACILKGDHVEGEEDEREEEQEGLAFSAIENLKEFQVIFAHPEALVGNKNVINLLKTAGFKNRIKAMVVDEAHFVVDWNDFRPSYGKLATIGSILPQVPLLGLTATATKKTRTDIIESLGMVNPVEILGNPDRPNICFSSSSRPDRGEDKLNEILVPLVESLKKERTKFPFTVVFGTLETISSCYSFFSQAMGKEQYEPIGAPSKAENRLFTQFHAQYPIQEKERIIDSLTLGKSKLRVVFATVAFGVGLDLKDIRQIIHIGLPCTMEEYFQEAGRAGRDGLPSKAHIYYNSYDTSKARKHLSSVMRDYVQSKKCKREIIMGYFGFSPLPLDTAHACCDYHEKLCSCDDCVLSGVASLMAPALTDQAPPLSNDEVYPYPKLNMEQIAKLNEELVKFRLSLPGHGRTTIGSTSLSSGVTIKLIREVAENAHTFSSAEDIEKRLPFFSQSHAISVWNIVKQFLQKV